jgi:sugar lactone lactonase YvrE
MLHQKSAKSEQAGSHIHIRGVIKMFRSSHAGVVGRFAITVFCAVLAACGGGSGDGGTAGTNGTAGSNGSSVVGGVSTTGTPGGTVTGTTTGTTVGTNTGGSTNSNTGSGISQGGQANALAARFNGPTGLAIDSSGNVYVADSGNGTIRRIAPNGSVTTIAGTPGVRGSADGVGAAAQFNTPTNITIDPSGNLYVVDAGNHTVRKIAPGNVVTTFAGMPGARGYANGMGTAARFDQPWGIAADGAGNVYVADTQNYAIRMITPAGEVSTFAGDKARRGRVDGERASASFLNPVGISIDAAGNLYVTDTYGPPAPNIPEDSTLIRKITPAGTVSTIAGNLSDGPTPAQFSGTVAVEADGEGNVYLADSRSIRRVSTAGVVTTIIDSTEFSGLQGIAMNGAGDLLVSDQGRHVVVKVTQGGSASIVAGAPNERGSSDTAP